MLALLKTKVALLVVGALAVTGVTGTATVVAAQQHAGPFTPNGVFGSHHQSPRSSITQTPDNQNFHAQGRILSVTFTASKTDGNLTFARNDSTTTITVRFTSQTHVEVAADTTSNADTTHGQSGAASLQAGLDANIVGTLLPDGTVLAREIQANAHGKAHQGGTGEPPTPNPGQNHHDGSPTPQPGNGHHEGTPTLTPGP